MTLFPTKKREREVAHVEKHATIKASDFRLVHPH